MYIHTYIFICVQESGEGERERETGVKTYLHVCIYICREMHIQTYIETYRYRCTNRDVHIHRRARHNVAGHFL